MPKNGGLLVAQNTAEKLLELAEPIVKNLGFTVWDTEFVKEGSEYYLRIYIDHEQGIGADDCETVSRALSDPLDEADFISHSYIFEVCSPGIERRLRLDWHFEAYLGQTVNLRLFKAVDGKKEITGTLDQYGNGSCTVLCDGAPVTVDIKNISKARTVFEF